MESVDEELKEDVKLNIMNNKVQFKEELKKMDLIMEVMDKDREFQ